jgi:hypothetical protein
MTEKKNEFINRNDANIRHIRLSSKYSKIENQQEYCLNQLSKGVCIFKMNLNNIYSIIISLLVYSIYYFIYY